MDRTALHLEIRNALALADELGRHEHARGDDDLAGHLAALRSSFSELERDIGRDHETALEPAPGAIEGAQRSVRALVRRRSRIPLSLKRRFGVLVASAERVASAITEPDGRVKSKPLFGVLPLARLVPQDVHSVMDYVSSAGFVASALLARTSAARMVGFALASGVAGASLVTDYRLSLAKLLPIEIHEMLDHQAGLSAAAAPFVLGYAKKDRLAALVQIAVGLTMCAAALVTDYRASKGVTFPRRSKGGPFRARSRFLGGGTVRVPDAQRPLEGLSSAPTDWQPDGLLARTTPMR